MKWLAFAFLAFLFLLCPFLSSAQAQDSQVEHDPGATVMGQYGLFAPVGGNGSSPLDGFTLMTGVFYPLNASMKDMYGGAFTIGGRYCFNMSRSVDLLGSISFVRNGGDPYYDEPTFTTGASSTLQFVPIEASMRERIVLMRNSEGLVTRGIYVGAGVNYVRAKEEIPDILSTKGGDFGIQLFVGPQVFFTENLALEVEMKVFINNVHMRDERNQYDISLSGLVVRAGISWYY